MTTAMARETAEIPEAVDRLLSDASPFQRAGRPVACARRCPSPSCADEAARPCRRISALSHRDAARHRGVGHRAVHRHELPQAVPRWPARCSSSSRNRAAARTSSPPREAARKRVRSRWRWSNDTTSPVAAAAALVVPAAAGPETGRRGHEVGDVLDGGVREVRSANSPMTRRWSRRARACRRASRTRLNSTGPPGADACAAARAAFVAARGYGFGPAREIALKLAETVRLPALGYSARRTSPRPPRRHRQATRPVLALRQQDATADTVDGLVADLQGARERVPRRRPASTLPWMGDDHPVCDPVCMLVPAYLAIERMAREAGLDPDSRPT